MSLTRLALRFAAPVPDLLSFERYLFVGPHPDDIEIGAGATAARLASMGKQIAFLICTDGRYGLDNAPKGFSQSPILLCYDYQVPAMQKIIGPKVEVRAINEKE